MSGLNRFLIIFFELANLHASEYRLSWTYSLSLHFYAINFMVPSKIVRWTSFFGVHSAPRYLNKFDLSCSMDVCRTQIRLPACSSPTKVWTMIFEIAETDPNMKFSKLRRLPRLPWTLRAKFQGLNCLELFFRVCIFPKFLFSFLLKGKFCCKKFSKWPQKVLWLGYVNFNNFRNKKRNLKGTLSKEVLNFCPSSVY